MRLPGADVTKHSLDSKTHLCMHSPGINHTPKGHSGRIRLNMKQPSAGNPCLPPTSFLYHRGPGSWASQNHWSLAPSPQLQLASKAGLILVSFSASFHPPDTSVCEIKTPFTVMAWMWTAVWGERQSLGVSWGLFLSCKCCQQEAEQNVRGMEAQRTLCSSPRNTSLQELPLAGGFCWKSQPWEVATKVSQHQASQKTKKSSIIP